jgi:phosphocarrier protein
VADEVVRTVTVVNRLGIHARAAAKFVTLASRFDAEIQVRNSRRTVNGKSIMGVMMLAAGKGTRIDLLAQGPEAEAAVAELVRLVNDRFGEDE